MASTMTSSRPYLIRAIYEWISDNGLTPYILVNAEAPGLTVPQQYIENGKIVLNIGERAVNELHMDSDWVLFNARFNGQAMDVTVPMPAVQAIYAKENGQGMVLDRDEQGMPPDSPPEPPREPPTSRKKPHLQIVK